MKTGTDAKRPGLYASECCNHAAPFKKDQTFTRCPKCNSLTAWELVELDSAKAA